MNKNTTVFLTRSLVDATGCNIWKGIKSKCKEENIPLLTLRGPVLNKGQGSIIYHLITDDSFNGIISWASSDVDQKTLDFYKQYQKTNLVCMTFKIPGHPLIITDCRVGILELMDHLIDVHKFTKIAFIRGPENHVYAKERYESYLESLQNHGIQIDEELISPCGGWAIPDGAKAVDDFIAKGLRPGKDFQAIVAVGDNVAIGAQERLIKKGFSIPGEVAICGFNGTNDAAWSNPPITTVEMPFFGLGVKGFETLKSLEQGLTVPQEIRYSTKLILGESCGCTSNSVLKSNFVKESSLNNIQLKKQKIKSNSLILNHLTESETLSKLQDSSWQNELKDSILNIVKNNRYSNSQIEDFFDSFSPKLISSFVSDLTNPQETQLFISTLSSGLNKYLSYTNEFSIWQDVISTIRNSSIQLITYNILHAKAENILQQSRIVINEFDCRTQKFQNLLESRNESTMRRISTEILSCTEMNELLNLITKGIESLKINSVYVALYNDCVYTEENQIIPQTSQLLLAVTNGERHKLPQGGLTFETTKILPDSIYHSNEYASFVLESLHYQDKNLGYIIFEGETENGIIFSSLRDIISCSLYSTQILEQRNLTRQLLESTMISMTDKADLVSSQSENITGNITTISSSMDNVAQNIKDVSKNISTVSEISTTAKQMVEDANIEIETLVEGTEQITNAIKMINDIAEKTNVLALNAAIEAAHAGDAGRGFSVVAKEVKSLAVQTVSSTQQIQSLVEKNNLNSKQTEELINKTNIAIRKIADLADNIKNSIQDQVQSSSAISTQLQGATIGTQQISNAITEIAKLGESLRKNVTN